MQPMQYYIQNTQQYVGNCILWWRKECQGYTTHLDDAMVVDQPEALLIQANRETDQPWPVDVVRAAASLQVDAQRLPSIKDL